MEKTAIILIAISLFILVIIVGLLTALIFKILKIEKPKRHPEIAKRIKEIDKIKSNKADIFCVNHPDEPGEVTCAICDELFCKACIRPFKSLHFCREHLPIVMAHEWVEVLTVKTSTKDPEQGVNLYQAKKHLFHSKNIPGYIEIHYKINVDQDYIETYLVFFTMAERAEITKEYLLSQS